MGKDINHSVNLRIVWTKSLRRPELAGVVHAMIFGIVFGTIYAASGRIFMLMVAHAAFDLTALAIIYWNIEYEVAHSSLNRNYGKDIYNTASLIKLLLWTNIKELS